MATAAVTYTFANGTNADGTQVNSNFTSVVNFLNTEVVQRDASVAFTAIPSLPATDPTTANQAVRKSYVDNYTPAGVITQYGGSSAPTGWLLCQGQAISRTNSLYTRLFTAISTTYGAGDGTTTFNVPNLQGRIPVGRDSTQTEFDALAETGGSKTSTLTTANLPSHQHGVGTIVPNTIADHQHGVGTISPNTITDHQHGVGTILPNTIADHLHGVGTILPNTIADHLHAFGTLATANTDLGSHNHTQNAHTHTASSTGAGGHSHGILAGLAEFAIRRSSYLTPGYVAGYDGNGDGLIDGTTSTLGGLAVANGGPNTDAVSSHTHPVTVDSQTPTNIATALGSHLHAMSGSVATGGGHSHTMTGSTATGGGHTHTMTGSTATGGGHAHTMSGSSAVGGGHAHTMSGSTALEGSGTAFSNLAPYIVVNYIIKL